MESPVFYAPPERWDGGTIELPAPEAHHAQTVLRLRAGALVTVIDGLGRAGVGEIILSGGRHLSVRVHSEIRNFGEPMVKVTLAAGLSTGSKFDEVVEKGTELGVSRFVPIITDKSKVRLDVASKANTRVTRLEKVALAAIKQCRRSYRPVISTPTRLKQYLRETDGGSLNLIFVPDPSATPLSRVTRTGEVRRVSILIGPESGFSADEVRWAVEAGFVTVTLGSRVLRTETAGPVCVALVLQMLGELS
ncbi:MAG: RsmE family RNA methyltransferase [Candidatus Zixiibacteriota bacterium]